MAPSKLDVNPVFLEAIECLPDGISIFDEDGVPILHNEQSVKRFPPPRGLAEVMDRAGLGAIRWTVLAGGIIAIHSAVRPG